MKDIIINSKNRKIMLCDYVGKDYHSFMYYSKLEKGDKVVIEFSNYPDKIVEIADEVPRPINYCVPNTLERLVKEGNGQEHSVRTCLMLYCESVQGLPLGKLEKRPDNFKPKRW